MRYAFGSLEFVSLPATDIPEGVDVTGDRVQIAFMIGADEPTDADLHDAEWATEDGQLVARIMRGPGALELDRATYRPWVKIFDSPEKPLIPAAGVVQVF